MDCFIFRTQNEHENKNGVLVVKPFSIELLITNVGCVPFDERITSVFFEISIIIKI